MSDHFETCIKGLKSKIKTLLHPANICLIKFANRNKLKKSKIFSQLIIQTTEWREWYRSGVFIVNCEHVWQLFPVFLLLTLTIYLMYTYQICWKLKGKTPEQCEWSWSCVTFANFEKEFVLLCHTFWCCYWT